MMRTGDENGSALELLVYVSELDWARGRQALFRQHTGRDENVALDRYSVFTN